MQTIDHLIRDRAGDDRVGLAFSDHTWTHADVVRAQAERAALLLRLRRPGPFHVALLMDNVPEYVFWMGGAALAGAVKCAAALPEGQAASIVVISADGGWKYLSTGAWTGDIDEVTERAKEIIYF